MRVLLGGLIAGQPVLFFWRPEAVHNPLYFAAVPAAFWAAAKLVFARDLKGLERAPLRLRPRLFYSRMAERHSRAALVCGFLASLLLVVLGLWMLNGGGSRMIAWLCTVFFGLCALGWGAALHLKQKNLQE